MTDSAHPLTAQAVVLEDFGRPLVTRSFDVSPAGPGELVVRCEHGGVCGTDVHLGQGHLDIPVPLVLGHEGLGTVHEVGAGLTHDAVGEPLAVGDTVMWASSISCGDCVPCRQWREPTLCENRWTYGVNRPVSQAPALSGSWADYIHLRAGTSVVRLPADTSPLAAMSLACAGPTMIHALYERRPVRVGETVVVQGSGPVGLAAAAIAHLSGAAQVIIVGGPAGRLELARQARIGDAHVDIVGDDDPATVLGRVTELTGGRGADLVIECTGAPAAVAQGLWLARRGGSYLIVGQYTDAGDIPVNPHQIVLRQLDIVGSWAFTGAHLVEYIHLLPAMTARFDLESLVTVFPLAAANDAVAAVRTGSVMKAVLST